MSAEPCWVPPRAVLDLHAQQIEEHGGAPGLRDRESLDWALDWPRQLHAQGQSGLCALAAALGTAIARGRPFVDGNRRMALVAMFVFLGLNGRHLDAREDKAYRVITALAAGELDEDQLSSWLAANLSYRSGEE